MSDATSERGREEGHSSPITVGVLSDTHGVLHASVQEALRGLDHIIHAGDVGSPQVLEVLRKLAPVTVVRGNCDIDSWALSLPLTAEVRLGEVTFLVAHVPRHALELQREWFQRNGTCGDAFSVVVVAGHTHSACIEKQGEVLLVNPGAAGPQRFGRQRTIARVAVSKGRAIEAEIRELA